VITIYSTNIFIITTSFVELCRDNKLDEAKSFYEQHKNRLKYDSDLSKKSDLNFMLYSLGGVDIRANDDQAFKEGCNLNHVNIIIWLAQMCSDYELTIVGYNINYKITSLKDKIKDKSRDEIIKILNIKTSKEILTEKCFICLDDANLKLHDKHDHCMCFDCMIHLYINNEKPMECGLCKAPISYHKMTLFI